MTRYEYKVVPAPTKGIKAKGVKSPEGRFSNALEIALNAQATTGWEYVRAEMLPSDERTGLTGSTTNWRNVLVFRRALDGDEILLADVAKVADAAPLETDEITPAAPQKSDAERKSDNLITVSGMFATRANSDTGNALETPEEEALASDEERGPST